MICWASWRARSSIFSASRCASAIAWSAVCCASSRTWAAESRSLASRRLNPRMIWPSYPDGAVCPVCGSDRRRTPPEATFGQRIPAVSVPSAGRARLDKTELNGAWRAFTRWLPLPAEPVDPRRHVPSAIGGRRAGRMPVVAAPGPPHTGVIDLHPVPRPVPHPELKGWPCGRRCGGAGPPPGQAARKPLPGSGRCSSGVSALIWRP